MIPIVTLYCAHRIQEQYLGFFNASDKNLFWKTDLSCMIPKKHQDWKTRVTYTHAPNKREKERVHDIKPYLVPTNTRNSLNHERIQWIPNRDFFLVMDDESWRTDKNHPLTSLNHRRHNRKRILHQEECTVSKREILDEYHSK